MKYFYNLSLLSAQSNVRAPNLPRRQPGKASPGTLAPGMARAMYSDGLWGPGPASRQSICKTNRHSHRVRLCLGWDHGGLGRHPRKVPARGTEEGSPSRSAHTPAPHRLCLFLLRARRVCGSSLPVRILPLLPPRAPEQGTHFQPPPLDSGGGVWLEVLPATSRGLAPLCFSHH